MALEMTNFDFEYIYNFGVLGTQQVALSGHTTSIDGQDFISSLTSAPYEVGIIHELVEERRKSTLFETNSLVLVSTSTNY